MLTPLFSFGDWIASPNVQIGIVIVTFVATIVAFIIGKIRSDIIALCSTAVLLTTGVIDAKAALAGFSNSAVVMMIGLFETSVRPSCIVFHDPLWPVSQIPPW